MITDIELDKEVITNIYSSVLSIGESIKLPGRKILVIDDSEFTRASIKNILTKNDLFDSEDILEAEDGLSGLRKFRENLADIDAVICDIMMKNFDGIKFIKALKDMEKDYRERGDIMGYFHVSSIPVIAITGTAPRARIEALEAGAKDFIYKPSSEIPVEDFERELVARLKVHIILKRSLEKLVELGENLYKTSIIDPLTSSFNRRYMNYILDIEVARIMRNGKTVGVVVFDIDDFKNINDTYGHLVGDEVLVYLSRIIFRIKRPYDYLIRYGGDEFLVVLPETRENGIKSFYERLKKALQEEPFTDKEGNCKIKITLSAGGTFFPSGVVKSADKLLKVADSALYEAKRSGKNKIVIFS